jgi:hypothetical protein
MMSGFQVTPEGPIDVACRENQFLCLVWNPDELEAGHV